MRAFPTSTLNIILKIIREKSYYTVLKETSTKSMEFLNDMTKFINIFYGKINLFIKSRHILNFFVERTTRWSNKNNRIYYFPSAVKLTWLKIMLICCSIFFSCSTKISRRLLTSDLSSTSSS